MGKKGIEIVGMDVNRLLELLNKAFADEWLAYYQYWIGAKIIVGPMRKAATAELEEHVGDELKHAGMLTDRIIQLGGKPIIKPEDWYKMTNCGYEVPEDTSDRTIIEQNIKGEQCAIDVYKKMLETLNDKDPITHNIILEILEDEVEHEEDLQALLEDLRTMK